MTYPPEWWETLLFIERAQKYANFFWRKSRQKGEMLSVSKSLWSFPWEAGKKQMRLIAKLCVSKQSGG